MRQLSKKLVRWTIKDLCECIYLMLLAKFDCVIFIDGKRGIGKSTLGYKIALRSDAEFSPEKDIAYTRDDVIKGLAQKIRGVILADEMINVAYNRDFYERDQKILLKALNMYRDHYNLFIGCIPFFDDLDKQMKKLCKIKITIIRRGIALIQLQSKSLYSGDPWDTEYNKKLEKKWKKNPKYAQFSTVKGVLLFNDLTKKQRETYDRIKTKKRNEIYFETSELNNRIDFKTQMINNLYVRIKEKKMTRKEFNSIVLTMGESLTNVRARLNQRLRDEGLEDSLNKYLLSEEEKEREKKKKLGKKRSSKFQVISSDEVRDKEIVVEDKSNQYHNNIRKEKEDLW